MKYLDLWKKKRLLSVFLEQEHRGGMLTGRVESVAFIIHYRSWNAVSLLQFFLLPLAMYVKSSLWFDQCQTDIWLAGRPNKSIIPFSAQFIIWRELTDWLSWTQNSRVSEKQVKKSNFTFVCERIQLWYQREEDGFSMCMCFKVVFFWLSVVATDRNTRIGGYILQKKTTPQTQPAFLLAKKWELVTFINDFWHVQRDIPSTGTKKIPNYSVLLSSMTNQEAKLERDEFP